MRCYVSSGGAHCFACGHQAPARAPGGVSCCTCAAAGGGACAQGEVCVKTDGDGGRCQRAPSPAPAPAPKPSPPGASWGSSAAPPPTTIGKPGEDRGEDSQAGPSAPGGARGSGERSRRALLDGGDGWGGQLDTPGAQGLGDLGILYGGASGGQGAGGGLSGSWGGGAGAGQGGSGAGRVIGLCSDTGAFVCGCV